MLKTNRWYILLVLTIVYAFNFIDRQIISIIAQDVKEDLGLSDTQVGMMTGLAFALFYSVMAIPISRFADKGNRKNVLSLCLAFWSIMTAVTGTVSNFTQMFLARMGVGLGEAGGVPTSYSMISDIFPPEERGKAMSIFTMGTSVGILAAFIGGGYVLVNYGWRMSLFVVGLPGLFIAIIVYLTIQEPTKGIYDNVKNQQESTPSILTIASIVFKNKTFINITLAKSFLVFTSYAVNAFIAIFFIRLHEMPKSSLFVNLGLAVAVGGIIGAAIGGYFSDKLGNIDIRWYSWIGIMGGIIAAPAYYIMFTTPNVTIALFSFSFATMGFLISSGPAIAVMQSVVDAKMRAGTAAFYLLISNLIGLGLGPLLIGIISDYYEPAYGLDSIRIALLFTFITQVLSIIFYWLAGRSYPRDIYVNMKTN